MKVVIQRVCKASVSISDKIKDAMNSGLLVLVGFEDTDSLDDIEWIASKVINLRVFDDSNGVINLSVKDIDGDILIVSQFTLHASTKKGNRPSYIKAANPNIAIPLYNQFVQTMEGCFGKQIKTGEFGADMQVSLINDGPVTIIIDSKNKE